METQATERQTQQGQQSLLASDAGEPAESDRTRPSTPCLAGDVVHLVEYHTA